MNDMIYVDLECFLVNQDTCLNNPNKSHATNIAQHIPSGYSTNVVRNHNNSSAVTYYREKDCIKKLCEELKEIGIELFNTEKKRQNHYHLNKKRFIKILKIVTIVNKLLMKSKKASFTGVLKKLKIIIITMEYTEV